MKRYLPDFFELATGILLGLIPLIIILPLVILKFGTVKKAVSIPPKLFRNSYQPIVEKDTGMDVLLMGHGGRGHDGGMLADAIILIHIDPKPQEISLIAIPRDIWVELPTRSDQKEPHKINMSYAIGNDDTGYPLKEPIYQGYHGGGNLGKHAVYKVTGLFPDYYVAIDFDSFTKAVDLLGGLDIDVPVTFTDEYYPVKGLENESCGKS